MNSSLFTVLLFFVSIPWCLSNPDWYTACNTRFVCGSVNADYPFWGNNRPDGCGIPDLKLKCENGTTKIEINSVEYHVLEIDNNDQTLSIARDDYTDGICKPQFINTTIDPNLFEYDFGYRNLTIMYGCPLAALQGLPAVFTCFISAAVPENGYALWDAVGPGTCYRSVSVPVYEANLETAVSNFSSLLGSLKEGFKVKLKVDNTVCADCIRSNGVCGYDIFSNQTTCYCPGQSTGSKTCTTSSPDGVLANPGGNSNPVSLGIGLAIAAAAATILSICLGCCYYYTRKRGFWSSKIIIFQSDKAKQDEKIEAFIMNYHSLMPRRYSYADIQKMTNSFMNKLGQGGFGGVYKGKLPDSRSVAVKVLNKSIGDGEEFINEVASISRTSHVNIVTLLGFCYTRTKRALIYEYMPNGSLDKFIYKQESQQKNLHTLYDIAIGIARGLEYLHRGCNTRIVHFDIKPQNVLLDKDFCPKISDFGLAKLCKGRESIVSMLGARGTAGYVAPEVFMRGFGGVSYKSDVYSYGMMILEMFGGTNDIDVGLSESSEMYFPDSIYKRLELGQNSIVDENITAEEEETIRRMMIIGLWCIQTNPSDRPSMTKVIEMLEGGIQSLQIPPKPLLFSTSNAPAPPDYSNTLSSTTDVESQRDEEKVLSLAEVS